MNLSSFKPSEPSDFIGPARRLAEALAEKAGRASAGNEPIKLLLFGQPGTGKTAIADMLSGLLTLSPFETEHYNGKQVGTDTVKGWLDSLAYGSIFGGYRVWHVDEVDRMSRDAQDLCLTFLDRMNGRRAFIGTSNLQLDLLQDRFQTRLQQFKLTAAPTAELTEWLITRFGTSRKIAERCAVGSGGNVRAALLDAQSFKDYALAG